MVLGLSGCVGNPNQAPVYGRASPPEQTLNYHLVSRGETLYSIAWRYGLDYKQLARRNRIDRNYTIFPGQKIYLTGLAPVPKSSSPQVKREPQKPARARSKTRTSATRADSVTTRSNASLQWQWPAQGKILARFSSSKQLNQGVDIAGKLGESVVAAADGIVVYAGGGIRGYGNLLIVKHNDKYLSAYAHNSKLLVKEQSQVKAGQKIAEIGSSGTDRTKLHFEIRRDGKPVDPVPYLPQR